MPLPPLYTVVFDAITKAASQMDAKQMSYLASENDAKSTRHSLTMAVLAALEANSK